MLLLRKHYQEQCDDLSWLMLETQFCRQRNCVLELLERYLLLLQEKVPFR